MNSSLLKMLLSIHQVAFPHSNETYAKSSYDNQTILSATDTLHHTSLFRADRLQDSPIAIQGTSTTAPGVREPGVGPF